MHQGPASAKLHVSVSLSSSNSSLYTSGSILSLVYQPQVVKASCWREFFFRPKLERMTSGGHGRKRPAEMEEPSSRKIVLKIQGPDGNQVTFRVLRDAPLQKVFRQYCEDKNFEYLAMNFILDGARVQVRRTPNELKLEDGDQIDAVVRVGGGGHLTI